MKETRPHGSHYRADGFCNFIQKFRHPVAKSSDTHPSKASHVPDAVLHRKTSCLQALPVKMPVTVHPNTIASHCTTLKWQCRSYHFQFASTGMARLDSQTAFPAPTDQQPWAVSIGQANSSSPFNGGAAKGLLCTNWNQFHIRLHLLHRRHCFRWQNRQFPDIAGIKLTAQPTGSTCAAR